MSNIKIVATIKAKTEHQDFLLPVFKKLVTKSRQEMGNLRYDLHRASENSQTFVFVETWISQEAVESHNKSEHFGEFLQAIEGKTESVEILLLDDISENTP